MSKELAWKNHYRAVRSRRTARAIDVGRLIPDLVGRTFDRVVHVLDGLQYVAHRTCFFRKRQGQIRSALVRALVDITKIFVEFADPFLDRHVRIVRETEGLER
ncbi:hypothetical protein OH799_08485 [Nocardia sp. NBC_00881]|uniref:hypothetical protein n=1 Tax=Nocardia sp. NBC_00881 TaxID=2975995 RepID=UPI0038662BDB|nr:hypothetical protein OH799_08485 [Nocardia sp. NBC_00881]